MLRPLGRLPPPGLVLWDFSLSTAGSERGQKLRASTRQCKTCGRIKRHFGFQGSQSRDQMVAVINTFLYKPNYAIIMNAEFHTCFHRELRQEWCPRRTPGCGAPDGRAPLEPRMGEIAPEGLPLGGWVEQLAARTPLHVMLPGHHDQELLCPRVMKGDIQTHDL